MMFNFLNISAIQDNQKEILEIKKHIFKLFYPDVKSAEENLFAEAAKAFGKEDEIVRMTTSGQTMKNIPTNFRK